MYEIWLVMNIVYEIALSLWPLLAVVLALDFRLLSGLAKGLAGSLISYQNLPAVKPCFGYNFLRDLRELTYNV